MPRARFRNYENLPIPYAPDWRFKRAEELFELLSDPSYPRRYCSLQVEGLAVKRLYEYLRQVKTFKQERRQARLIQDYFDIHEAFAIHAAGGLRALEMRMRLLAGQSSKTIGRCMDIDYRVVFAYCVYLFDFRCEGAKSQFSMRLCHSDRGNLTEYCVTQNPQFELFCYAGVLRLGVPAVPVYLDAFKHLSEQHDLSTPLGRRRDLIECLYLNLLANNDHTPRARMLMVEVLQILRDMEWGQQSFEQPSPLDLLNSSTPRQVRM